MPKVAAVIPAGGVGARFGARTPKQFLRLGRLSILAATVRHFARHPAVRAVVVAAPESWVARARRILGRVAQDASLTVVAGGRTRQDSVWLALQAAHEKARRDGVVGTDDAMLVERLGHPVRVVRGLVENVKITTPADLRRARSLAGR